MCVFCRCRYNCACLSNRNNSQRPAVLITHGTHCATTVILRICCFVYYKYKNNKERYRQMGRSHKEGIFYVSYGVTSKRGTPFLFMPQNGSLTDSDFGIQIRCSLSMGHHLFPYDSGNKNRCQVIFSQVIG